MNFLLDTNVVSEWVKPAPNPGVIAWLADADEDRIFISVVSLLELRYGVERMPAGSRRRRLSEWLEQDLPIRFEGRVLHIDAFTADACGKLIARSEMMGRPIEVTDALIAATAEIHQATIVTRNTTHFEAIAGQVLNPWR
ncbi:MAG TPA: type II toxin-antitoxin system VapC family toxin [Terriglobales bacterium]